VSLGRRQSATIISGSLAENPSPTAGEAPKEACKAVALRQTELQFRERRESAANIMLTAKLRRKAARRAEPDGQIGGEDDHRDPTIAIRANQ